jgi:hypothetical protein
MIDFLQTLFNLVWIIGMLSNWHERVHFQVFQLKTSIQLKDSNENIDDNINNNEYGFSLNDIIIEEKEYSNENET